MTELPLGLLMFLPYRALETRVLDALREHGHDLPLHQARVFQRVGPAGSRMSELAAATQLTKQTLGSIVDQLERGGYVERIRDPADGRARFVRLTALGHELVDITVPVVRAVESEWEAHLGVRRTRELRRTLTALRAITDPWA